MAYVAAIAAIAAVAISTYAAVDQSQKQAALQKDIKKQKEIEAKTMQETAAYNERQHRRRMSLLLGQQRAGFAAAGLGGETPFAFEMDLVKQGELEALALKREGAIGASEREFEASVAQFQRRAAIRQAPVQIAGGIAGAVSGGYGAYTTTKYYQTPNTNRRSRSVAGSMYSNP